MADGNRDLDGLAARVALVLPHLDERQRRLLLGAEAKVLGRGGIRAVASASGVAERTISRGIWELETGESSLPPDRVRRPGGGRKPTFVTSPGIFAELDRLIDPADPAACHLRWTTKSTRALAAALTARGHPVTHSAVAKLLKVAGYHLLPPRKSIGEATKDAFERQFRHVSAQAEQYIAKGEPVMGIWATRREWVTSPESKDPYLVRDVLDSLEWSATESDKFTVQSAVGEIRRWWVTLGEIMYPRATVMLVSIGGMSLETRQIRNWTEELTILRGDIGLPIEVCHLPPATAKWNSVAHRLIGHVVVSAPGVSSAAHQVVIDLVTGSPADGQALVVRSARAPRYRGDIATMIKRPQDEPSVDRAWNYSF